MQVQETLEADSKEVQRPDRVGSGVGGLGRVQTAVWFRGGSPTGSRSVEKLDEHKCDSTSGTMDLQVVLLVPFCMDICRT